MSNNLSLFCIFAANTKIGHDDMRSLQMTTSIDIARRIAEVNHPLSRESVHALAEILVCRKYRKGEIVFLQAGEVCKSMLFIEKGMLRQFYYKYDKDLTQLGHIGYENGMIICIVRELFLNRSPPA